MHKYNSPPVCLDVCVPRCILRVVFLLIAVHVMKKRPETDDQPEADGQKSRRGCLTGW